MTGLQHVDDPVAGHVQVFTGVVAMLKRVVGKGGPECAIEACRIEDLQRLAQIRDLIVLVADILAHQTGRAGLVPNVWQTMCVALSATAK